MLLVWSGGCDSTLLLHDLVKDSTENNPVKTIAIIHPQVAAMKEQRSARKMVLKWMKKNGHHIHHQEVEVKHTGELIRCNGSNGVAAGNGGISQYTMWMFTALNYLDAEEDLYMGYIHGDDIWWYRHEIWESFRHLLYIMGKKGELKFPLGHMKKSKIIESLKERGLYNLIWYCETPNKGKRCGRCEPCIKHDVSIFERQIQKSRNEITDSPKMRRKLKKRYKTKRKT